MILSARNKSGILTYWDEQLNACKVKSPKENPEQVNLNSHCSSRWPDLSKMMWHVVNESGSSGDSRYGGELKKRGRKKGVPDWHVMVPSNGYHGLYIELKRSRKKDATPISKDQREFLLLAESLGYQCIVAYGYKAALQAIEDYFDNNIAV
jgi:hypothetical protein